MQIIKILAIVVCIAFVSSAHAATSVNLAAALADTKASLAVPGGSTDILVVGDSLSSRVGSYIYPFREKMQQVYGDGGPGYQPFSQWSGAGLNAGWTMAQLSGDTPPNRAIDGLWVSTTAATGAHFTAKSDQISLHYVAGPGGGSFNVRRSGDGSLVTIINSYALTNEVRTFDYTFAPGESRKLLYDALGTGEVTFLGQDNLSGSPGVQVQQAVHGGWGVDEFLDRDWNFGQQANLLSTDMILVWLGANDPQYDRVTYAAKLNLLVDRLQTDVPDAEIVLVGGFELWYDGYTQRVHAMEDVANQRGIGFVSLLEAGGTYDSIVANGWLDDGIHFSEAGGEHFGQLLFDAFMTDGASLVPEPSGLGAIMFAWVAFARRRRSSAGRA